MPFERGGTFFVQVGSDEALRALKAAIETSTSFARLQIAGCSLQAQQRTILKEAVDARRDRMGRGKPFMLNE